MHTQHVRQLIINVLRMVILLVSNYANIFTTEDHKEVLLVRKYNASRDLGNKLKTLPGRILKQMVQAVQNQPTWNLVQAYTMNNGLPITHASSGYNNIMFWQNRDPRFEASIAYNGGAWPLSGKATRKQWSHTGVPDEACRSTL